MNLISIICLIIGAPFLIVSLWKLFIVGYSNLSDFQKMIWLRFLAFGLVGVFMGLVWNTFG